MITLYIAPPVTDRASQYRIFAASLNDEIGHAWQSYKNNPRIWTEVGLVNARGELVCLEACKSVFDEVKACEPLMCGTTFQFDSLHNNPQTEEDWQPVFHETAYYIYDGKVHSDIIASGLSLGDALRMQKVGNLFRTSEDARQRIQEERSSESTVKGIHKKVHP